MASKTKVIVMVDGVEVGRRMTNRVAGYPFAVIARETPASYRRRAESYRAEEQGCLKRARECEHRADLPSGTVYDIANNGYRSSDVVVDDDDPRLNGKEMQILRGCHPEFANPKNRTGEGTFLHSRSFLRAVAQKERERADDCSRRAVNMDNLARAGKPGPWGVHHYAGRRDLAEKQVASADGGWGREVRVVETVVGEPKEIKTRKPAAKKAKTSDLGGRLGARVLLLLQRNPGRWYTVSEVSKATGGSYAGTSRALYRMARGGEFESRSNSGSRGRTSIEYRCKGGR